ncbi:MAG: chloride channel protein [Bacteroidia bacterium]|nr:chloride channel protein [Bacteroidia bacterium]
MEWKVKQIRFLLKYPVYKFFKNRSKYISNQNFLILASLLIAVVSSAAAIFLKWLIHTVEGFSQNTQFIELQYKNIFFPAIGILLSLIFVRYIMRLPILEKGLASIIYKVNYKHGDIEGHHTYAHLITSALTVGFGGSVGVEAPIALTGSALGSNVAKRLFVSQQEKNLLLACGAAAGISAIFNCPVAAVIFSFEVILSRATVSAFIPLMIASATAALINGLFYQGQLIQFQSHGWNLSAIPWYIVLGVLAGLLSAYTIQMIYHLEHRFGNTKLKINKALTQGGIVGVLILFFPMLYGEGYSIINTILAGDIDKYLQNIKIGQTISYDALFLLMILLTLLLKPVAAAFTVSSGGNGGVFAPSLFNGALLGLLLSRAINLSGISHLNELNFVICGMAGVLSGVLSAPLTGIFMIAEVSGGYSMFIPLMLVSALSFFVTRFIEPNSIYTKRLAAQGLLNNHNKENELLKSFSVRCILETDFQVIQPEQSLREALVKLSQSRRNLFPVVTRSQKLVGILTLDDLKQHLFKPEAYDRIKVKDLMQALPEEVELDQSLIDVKAIFEAHPDMWNIPVTHENKYAGFISKSSFLNKYKDLMQDLLEHESR